MDYKIKSQGLLGLLKLSAGQWDQTRGSELWTSSDSLFLFKLGVCNI